MKKQLTNLLIAGICSFGLISTASAVLIDNFSPQDGTVSVSSTSGGFPSFNTTLLDDLGIGIIGGERDLIASANGGSGANPYVVTGAVSGGELGVTANGTGSLARIRIDYDGNDNSSTLQFGANFDLTSGGLADRFIIDISNISGSISAFLSVNGTSLSNTSSLNNISLTSTGSTEVLFSSLLPNLSGGAANLASAGSLQFQFNLPNESAFINIDRICTGSSKGGCIIDSVATVPVPAAAWLFGSGLLGLIGVARRKA